MGFFGNLLSGKPAFEAPHEATGDENAPATPPKHNLGPVQKYIPEVEIEETECHISGTHMRLSCDIKNESSVEIELDKIQLLRTTRMLRQRLKPHEKRRFIVYEGPLLINRNEKNALLDYQGLDGDDFQTYHMVEFKQEPDKTYSVSRLKRANPVKDT